MNGFNMNQFVLGFAIARQLADQRDRVMVGLAASMFPASNPLGAILLKPQVDALSASQGEAESLKQEVSAARTLIDIANKPKAIKTNETAEFDFPVIVTEAKSDDSNIVEVKRDGRKVVLTSKTVTGDVPITIKVGSFELKTKVTVE